MKHLKTLSFGSAAAIALMVMGTSANADVTVTSTVTKDKQVSITVDLLKEKFVDIFVTFNQELVSAAEAHALANVTNQGNTVDKASLSTLPDPDPETLGGEPFGIQLDALIEASINDNTGVVSVNQDVGNMVNQGNILAVAAVNPSEEAAAAFSHSESVVDQRNMENTVVQIEEIEDPEVLTPDKTAFILDSINGNSGVVSVNQNAGNMNNQTNAVGLAVAFGAALALSEAQLGQVNMGNSVTEFETVKEGLIQGSVNTNTGIMSGNQSTGNMNNQANSIAFSALTTTAVVGVPGGS